MRDAEHDPVVLRSRFPGPLEDPGCDLREGVLGIRAGRIGLVRGDLRFAGREVRPRRARPPDPERPLDQSFVGDHVQAVGLRQGASGLHRAVERARVHRAVLEMSERGGKLLRVRASRLREADVETAVAAAARVLARLGVPEEDQPTHNTATAISYRPKTSMSSSSAAAIREPIVLARRCATAVKA